MDNKKFFGTDGIRGKVGVHPLTPDLILKLGWAAGRVLSKRGHGKAVIGKDTRISGYMYESALEAGLSAAGIDTLLLGPIPTPGIAYLTRTLRAQLGVVISASHNPYEDNGIKFFSQQGSKLSDEIELEIEQQLEKTIQTVDSADLGKAKRIVDAQGRYIEFCKSTAPSRVHLDGLRIVVDCANGAAYQIAPNVFAELGAEVFTLGVEPDGLNINDGVGSTCIDTLVDAVKMHRADVGIALDGDADRVMMVDEKGHIIDGDQLLYVIAMHSKSKNYHKGGVVGTLMSNLGLEQALQNEGFKFVRAQVGDRYVLEQLHQHQWDLGGESSGHIICLHKTTTGDGVVSALQVLTAMFDSQKLLSELVAPMQKYPQVLLGQKVAQRVDPFSSDKIVKVVHAAEQSLAQKGRVLLRTSGTENKIRIMVEGEDNELVNHWAEEIAAEVKQEFA